MSLTVSRLDRRDFLKVMTGLAVSLAVPGVIPSATSVSRHKSLRPNIIILVLDAMSAENMSLYGYARETTPQLSRLAERATVYHSHYAAGNYTTPGTASILTGMYPWSHRAINIRSGIRRSLLGKDLFGVAGPEYFRAAFTQNMLADVFLRQAHTNLELHLPLTAFQINDEPGLASRLFGADPLIPYYAFDNSIVYYSVLSTMFLNYWNVSTWNNLKKYSLPSDAYPYGIPFNTYNFFRNDIVYDGIRKLVTTLAAEHSPFLAYFHLFSPHEPYRPRKDFVDIFPGIDLPRKPEHPLAAGKKFSAIVHDRQHYDEFIAEVDAEVGRFIDGLDRSGLLENTYLFILADHGELFERGEQGHLTPLMYEPVVHIPLIVFAPGQNHRRDVLTATSNVDILPTVAKIIGREPLISSEGRILPGFGGEDHLERNIFTVEAKRNPATAPLTRASVSMIRNQRKLIYYLGYPGFDDSFELFDLHDDPEELDDIFSKDTLGATNLKEELLDALAGANHAFRFG